MKPDCDVALDWRYGAAPNLFDILPRPSGLDNDYAAWVIDHDSLAETDERLICAQLTAWPRLPLISVLMPVRSVDGAALGRSIASLEAQLYPSWELCIADDASPVPEIVEVLKEAASSDPRVRWAARSEIGGVAAAIETARALATGVFIAVLYSGDTLAAQALYEVAHTASIHPEADVIFTDEDRMDLEGRRLAPCFKPMWSPELLAGHDAVGHLAAYRASLIEVVGGWRPDFAGAQDWDLALRATAATTPDKVHHIPAVLYHRMAATRPCPDRWLTHCRDAGRRAVASWLAAEGAADASVLPAHLAPGCNRVVYALPDPPPMVTVIMPTRDRADLLKRACQGVLEATDWPPDRLELLVVDNDSTEPAARALLRRLEIGPRTRVLRVPGPFNYPVLNNRAVREARGSVLVLLNNDIEVAESAWLAELVRLAIRREIGAVGAKLLYPDGTVQHGGVVMGPDAQVGHVLRFLTAAEPAYFGQLAFARALCVVTGACLALRREVFEEVGGLDEALAVTYNDADLCLRVRARGYRVVWTPDAVLTHHESATRGQDSDRRDPARTEREWAFMRNRWGRVLDIDPYHNPNLLLHEGGGPRIPSPPRRPRPWRPRPGYWVAGRQAARL